MKKGNEPTYRTVDEYIEQASKEAQPMLRELRKIIRENAPEAEERISYQMPGYFYHGPLVYFGGFKHHVSFFGAGSSLFEKYKEELKGYRTSKGTIQFPIGTPLPQSLLGKLVRERFKENALRIK